MQIAKEAEALVANTPLKVLCVVGGQNINRDLKALSGRIDILVATPGR